MTMLQRAIVSGSIAGALYGVAALSFVFLAGAPVKPMSAAAPALLIGISIAFAIGSLIFGLIPHFLGIFMASASSSFDLLNKASLAVALFSIFVGVVSALMLIFGISEAGKPLLVSITLFLGAAAVMCSLKFFYQNRDKE